MKKGVVKNRFILNYLMRMPRNCFPDVKFCAKFEVALQLQFLSIIANHSTELLVDFSTIN